jgi:hypothetical protein
MGTGYGGGRHGRQRLFLGVLTCRGVRLITGPSMSSANILDQVLARAIVPLLVIVTLVFPYTGGAGWAYFLIVATVVATAMQALPPRPFRIGAADALFVAAFLLILAAYAITHRPGTRDVLFALNFAMFLFFVPLRALFAKSASLRNTVMVARLAFGHGASGGGGDHTVLRLELEPSPRLWLYSVAIQHRGSVARLSVADRIPDGSAEAPPHLPCRSGDRHFPRVPSRALGPLL